ncbi:MAG: cellulose synthase complex periplasmic endoglucanase BcsZ [Acidobacteriaceae bacterium]
MRAQRKVAVEAKAIVCATLLLLFVGRALPAHCAAKKVPSSAPKAATAWPLWKAYQARFLDANGRVIDHDAGDRTTSEGQAYALFFSLVANDRPQFDRVLNWTIQNLAQGDLTAHLPAWEWGRAPDGTWHALDSNSAADADLWTAYTLVQAGRLWGEPRYRSLGLALAALIAQREVRELPGLGPVLLPAASGFDVAVASPQANANKTSTQKAWVLNPSYSPLPLLTGMAHADPPGPWRAMAAGLPGLLEKSSIHGFAMDWVSYRTNSGFLPASLPGSLKDAQPVGSYDAVRVYLWAGIAPHCMPGASATLGAIAGMRRYLTNHAIPPRLIDAQGKVAAEDGGVGFSAALVPYLLALHAPSAAAQQQQRMAALLDPHTGLYGTQPKYYDQNLALFAEGWTQRRYRFSCAGALHVSWTQSMARGDAHSPNGPTALRRSSGGR